MHRQTEKILIIDDEKMPLIVHHNVLRSEGYTVQQISGLDAIDEAYNLLVRQESEQFDLLIIDIMMPEGDTYKDRDTDRGHNTGILLYQDLRKKYPRKPMIIYTNILDEGVAGLIPIDERLLVLPKYDCSALDLLQKVKELLAKSRREEKFVGENDIINRFSQLDHSDSNYERALFGFAYISNAQNDKLVLGKMYELHNGLSENDDGFSTPLFTTMESIDNLDNISLQVFVDGSHFDVEPYDLLRINYPNSNIDNLIRFYLTPLDVGHHKIEVDFFHNLTEVARLLLNFQVIESNSI